MESKENESEICVSMTKEDEVNKLNSIDEEKINNNSVPNLIDNDEFSDNDSKQMKLERSRSLDPSQKLNGFHPIKERISSIMSLGDIVGDAILSDPNENTKDGKW